MHRLALRRAVGRQRLGRVLDFGCGAGRMTIDLAQYSEHVVGVDISSEMVERARCIHRDPRVEFVTYDGQTLPFPDESFDAALTVVVLQLYRDEPARFRSIAGEIARVLRPGASAWLIEQSAPPHEGEAWSPDHWRTELSKAELELTRMRPVRHFRHSKIFTATLSGIVPTRWLDAAAQLDLTLTARAGLRGPIHGMPDVRGSAVSAGGQRTTHRHGRTTDAPHEPGGEGPEQAVAPRSLIANSTWLLSSRLVGTGVRCRPLDLRHPPAQRRGLGPLLGDRVAGGDFRHLHRGRCLVANRARDSDPSRAGTSGAVARDIGGGAQFLCLAALDYRGLVRIGIHHGMAGACCARACLVATQGLAVPLYAIFNARRAFSYTAVIAGVMVPVAAIVGAPLVALGLGPPALLIGALVGQLTSAIVGHALVRKRLGMSLGLRWPRGPTLRFMRTAAPIAATGGLTIVYQRLDILMLSKLGGAAEVAAYAVPYSMLQYSWMVPAAVAAAFFPVLSDTLRRDAERASYLFFLIIRLFFLAIVPGAIFLAVASRPILTTVFGDKYAESAGTLAILAAVVVLTAQNYVLWYGIFAGRKEGLVIGVQAAGLAVNAALNLALIRAFGAEGAASALVVVGVGRHCRTGMDRAPLGVPDPVGDDLCPLAAGDCRSCRCDRCRVAGRAAGCCSSRCSRLPARACPDRLCAEARVGTADESRYEGPSPDGGQHPPEPERARIAIGRSRQTLAGVRSRTVRRKLGCAARRRSENGGSRPPGGGWTPSARRIPL